MDSADFYVLSPGGYRIPVSKVDSNRPGTQLMTEYEREI